MANKIIDVWVILFPDGTSHHFKASDGKEYLDRCIRIWKEKNKQKYAKIEGVNMAVAHIRMLEIDFNKMLATDYFIDAE